MGDEEIKSLMEKVKKMRVKEEKFGESSLNQREYWEEECRRGQGRGDYQEVQVWPHIRR